MSQRDSGYVRIERDLYETPEWVTLALLPHLPKLDMIWECAAASGKMGRALAKAPAYVVSTDIDKNENFLNYWSPIAGCDAIITNPPYELATEFISHALQLMRDRLGLVAMLLRTDFDHAKTRQNLFANHPAFSKKLVLTKRIKWFEDSKGQPSFNHAWFIWDWKNRGLPNIVYGP